MTLDHWLILVGIWTLAGLPLGPRALNGIAVSAQQGFGRLLSGLRRRLIFNRFIAGFFMAAGRVLAVVDGPVPGHR